MIHTAAEAVWIFNTSSGSLVKIVGLKGPEYGLIPDYLTAEDRVQLAASNILVPQEFDELSNIQTRLDVCKTTASRFAVTIAPTLGCNFSCSYCFERKTDAWKNKTKMADKVKTAVRDYIISNLVGRSALNVRWFGGEPLLAWNSISELSKDLMSVCKVSNKTYRAEMQTNGFLLKPSVSRELSGLGIENVHVTLDGARRDHNKIRFENSAEDSFQVIYDNLQELPENIRLSIRVNVSKANHGNIPELLNDLSRDSRIKKANIYFAPLYSYFNGDERPGTKTAAGFLNVEEYAKIETGLYRASIEAGFGFAWGFLEPKDLPCSAVKVDDVMLDFDGNILKCDHEFGVKEAIIGTVETGITNGEKLLAWSAVHPKNNPLCPSCALLPACLGHCANLRKHVDAREACPPKKYNHVELLEMGIEALTKNSPTCLSKSESVEVYILGRRAHPSASTLQHYASKDVEVACVQ